MPATCHDPADLAEIGEVLKFLRDWLATDRDDRLDASLRAFVGSSGYDLQALRADLDRLAVLLVGGD